MSALLRIRLRKFNRKFPGELRQSLLAERLDRMPIDGARTATRVQPITHGVDTAMDCAQVRNQTVQFPELPRRAARHAPEPPLELLVRESRAARPSKSIAAPSADRAQPPAPRPSRPTPQTDRALLMRHCPVERVQERAQRSSAPVSYDHLVEILDQRVLVVRVHLLDVMPVLRFALGSRAPQPPPSRPPSPRQRPPQRGSPWRAALRAFDAPCPTISAAVGRAHGQH